MSRTIRTVAIATLIALLAGSLALPASAAAPRIKLKQILSGYTRPLLVANDGGNNRVIYVVEQAGVIHRATFRNGKWTRLGEFLDISERVLSPLPGEQGERGLLGLAFHPDYKKNGRFYVNYTRVGEDTARGDTVIAEFSRLTRSRGDPDSERVVMLLDQPISNHNGGHLAFGPDGKLYVAVGDGGGHEDPGNHGQDTETPFGTILRINPNDPDGSGPRDYAIPSGNPLVGKAGLDEIWAYGLRNPWRFSFDRKNGHLWIADVGEETREEVNRAKSNRFGMGAGKGKNYGWSDCEGRFEFKDDEGDADDKCSSHTLPVYDYANDRALSRCSVTGGYVHRGPSRKDWHGLYVAGDFCGALFVLSRKGKERLIATTNKLISSFGEDSAGRLFATDITGSIHLVKLSGPRP